MKKLLLACTLLTLSSSFALAASTTDMTSKWICTTNASSSEMAADKTADENMPKSLLSASDSFAFAAKNCRDCTKITCEAKD